MCKMNITNVTKDLLKLDWNFDVQYEIIHVTDILLYGALEPTVILVAVV